MTEQTILRTIRLSKQFGARNAVDDLNLEVHRGDIFGFLGPNGAGKSTTIRMILTLLHPSAGHVELFGSNVAKDRRVLSRVGGIVERPDFYLYLSAYKNLELFGSMTRPVTRKEITDVLELVGLGSRVNDRVKTFSHGMKQRLGIAQTLLTKPDLVILDEPTNGLDPQGMVEVRELVMLLSREHGMTIFLSSHILSEVERVATRMAVINHGQLITQGSVSELLNSASPQIDIQASPHDQAVALLQSLDWLQIKSTDGDLIRISVDQNRAAEVNSFLVSRGVQVSLFAPRKTLEDFFLTVTDGASES